MDSWNLFPPKQDLLKSETKSADDQQINVNAHMHTPYSFSAFESVEQAIQLASEQDVRVVGINDFFTTDGYQSWAEACANNRLFPLFNIEFIGLSKEDQDNNIRINDPSNPGRIYISGKGLSYPFYLEEPYLSKLAALKPESNNHAMLMCDKLNQHLSDIQVGFQLDYNQIMKTHTKGMLRERHLAKVLREKVYEIAQTDQDINNLFQKIFSGKALQSDINKHAAVENEIRGVLLKSGGPAFVPENPDSFLPMETVRGIIINAGGIPTYPLLADDKNGKFTDFEEDKKKLARILKARGFFSVEFITIRNTTKVLEKYASYFEDEGFVVSFGSEHNTPELSPIKLYTTDSIGLTDTLKKINYRGACVIAAHQYLMATQGSGYLSADGTALINERENFISLGNKIIQYFLNN